MANQLPSVTPLVIGDWIGAWEFFKEQFISGLYKPPFTLKDVKIKGGYGMKSRIKNFKIGTIILVVKFLCVAKCLVKHIHRYSSFFFYSEAYHK